MVDGRWTWPRGCGIINWFVRDIAERTVTALADLDKPRDDKSGDKLSASELEALLGIAYADFRRQVLSPKGPEVIRQHLTELGIDPKFHDKLIAKLKEQAK